MTLEEFLNLTKDLPKTTKEKFTTQFKQFINQIKTTKHEYLSKNYSIR